MFRKKNVMVETWPGNVDQKPDKFARACQEILYPVIKCTVKLHAFFRSHSHTPPLDEEAFHVWIWSSPLANADYERKKGTHLAWGHPIATSDAAFSCAESGFFHYQPACIDTVIFTPDTCFPIAEIVGENNLYVYVPLMAGELGSPMFQNGALVFRRILEDVVGMFQDRDKKRLEQRKNTREYRATLARNAYVRACKGNAYARLDLAQGRSRELPDKIAQARKKLAELIREQRTTLQEIEVFSKRVQCEEEDYKGEFEQIASLPEVNYMECIGNVFQVYTHTLFCPDDRTGKLHEIGRFCITFDLLDPSSVRWRNLDRQIGARQAPCVDENGKARLGNVAEVFLELFAKRDIPLLISYAIQFVQQVDVDDDMGKSISQWPIAASNQKMVSGVT